MIIWKSNREAIMTVRMSIREAIMIVRKVEITVHGLSEKQL